MPQRLIYHWKHGWIPLDHYAALQKAHYRESGARLIMARHGIAAERDAKHIAPEHGKSRTLEKGLNQQAGQHQKRMAGEDPHFRMPGPQLKELAGKGDKGAQAELDRRAARKAAAGGKFGGHKQGVPFRPSAAAPEPPKEDKPAPAPLRWQPGTIPQDGTFGSRRAAEKAKQVFEAGNKRVIIETALSKEKTQALLADVAHVVEQSGVHDVPVTFRVPVGDRHFAIRRGGMVGGYVFQGGQTVHISPHVATEDALGQGFGMDTSGKFMPANGQTSARQWVITHELGHVVDNYNGHTRQDVNSRDRVAQLTKQHRDTLSGYGKSSAQEAYAEAFAQWIHGGPGSSPAADAFAAEYGWPIPKRFK